MIPENFGEVDVALDIASNCLRFLFCLGWNENG